MKHSSPLIYGDQTTTTRARLCRIFESVIVIFILTIPVLSYEVY